MMAFGIRRSEFVIWNSLFRTTNSDAGAGIGVLVRVPMAG